jgi:hypothetical protein
MSPRLLLQKISNINEAIKVLAAMLFFVMLGVLLSTRIQNTPAQASIIDPSSSSDIGGCQTGADCSPLEHCDTGTGECVPNGCIFDLDCSPQQSCIDGSCTSKYTSSSEAGCQGDQDCGYDQRCNATTSTCVSRDQDNSSSTDGSCQGDQDCGYDEHCNATSGSCEPNHHNNSSSTD